jgi:hypothetical protein
MAVLILLFTLALTGCEDPTPVRHARDDEPDAGPVVEPLVQ